MKGRAVIIGLVVGLTVLLLIYFFASGRRSLKYQWYQSFKSDSKEPYGIMFIQKMLKSYYDGEFVDNQKLPIHKLLADPKYNDGSYDYVLIGQSIHLDDADVTALQDFIASGSDVFIATMEAPKKLIEALLNTSCEGELTYDYRLDTVVYANFYEEEHLYKPGGYEFRYRQGAEDYPYFWRSIDEQAFCDTTSALRPLGYQNDTYINFAAIDFGPGRLFLHTAPVMFTNYYMTNESKMMYASSVFTHLDDGENLIWDEASKVPFSDLDNPYDSPLYYIMQQPALKYAWWMLLIGALLYIIFASKRTQRVIPVLETKTNTSLEFLNVISSLHYQNPNHFDMARKKMKYFLYFIRAKYGINTQTLTEEQSKRLAERSKVDLADIKAITDRYKVIENYSISNDEPERLVELYQAIEKFYKTCK